MEYTDLSAPRSVVDLYSLFAWVMPKSNHNYFGCYGLSQALIYNMDVTLNLISEQFGSCDPYYCIQYYKELKYLWSKDIHQYEQKPSKKSSY